MDALQNLFGVENNQVLIRKYEITGTDFHSLREAIYTERRIIGPSIVLENIHKILTIMNLLIYLCLKNIFRLFEEPADDVVWLRIKQPDTYTIHFDITRDRRDSSFSFELHTRDEIIHFSEHNPKRNINLEKDENGLLVLKEVPEIIRAGSKIYVYYNI